jgi:DNA-binding CsgD family transcriptional regulator
VDGDERRPQQLSPRELEVLELLCAGSTAREIATALGISVGTVANRRQIVYQKLGVSSAVEACAAYATLAAGGDHPAVPPPAPGPAGSTPDPPPIVRTNPIRDSEFRAEVRSALAERPGWPTPTELEDRLREVYPSTVVRVRSPERGGVVWDVFRASHVVTHEAPWAVEASDAWLLYDASGTLIEMSAAAETLLSASRAAEVGRSLFEAVGRASPAAQEDVRRLWATVLRRGMLRSSFRVPRPDGTAIDVDVVVARADEGRYRAILRPSGPGAMSGADRPRREVTTPPPNGAG